MFSTGLRAKQMGRRYLSDVQLSHLYKCWAAELPGIGRWLPHCQSPLALFPAQPMMEHGPSSGVLMLPQCPPLANLVINMLTVKWRHIAPQTATCVFFCSGHNSSSLAYTCINSLVTLHQGWLHFHLNYCCYGNCPKEVITQVAIVTMAIWHWAECSSSDDFKVDAEHCAFFFFQPEWSKYFTVYYLLFFKLSSLLYVLFNSQWSACQFWDLLLLHSHTHPR